MMLASGPLFDFAMKGLGWSGILLLTRLFVAPRDRKALVLHFANHRDFIFKGQGVIRGGTKRDFQTPFLLNFEFLL